MEESTANSLEPNKEESKFSEKFCDLSFQYFWLMEIKTFATLAINHIMSVEDPKIPEDPEFRQQLYVLLNNIATAAEHLDEPLEILYKSAAYKYRD